MNQNNILIVNAVEALVRVFGTSTELLALHKYDDRQAKLLATYKQEGKDKYVVITLIDNDLQWGHYFTDKNNRQDAYEHYNETVKDLV